MNLIQSSKLDHVSYELRGPELAEAARMEEQGQRVLKLNIGNPGLFGFEAPDEILQDMIRMLPSAQGYSDSKGILPARRAVAQYYETKGVPDVDVDDVYLGNGVSELIQMVTQALVDDGDEVLVPKPDYPLWTGCVHLAGGRAVHYRCDEQNEWYPDLDDMEAKVSPRTKAIVVINPNNPTGAVYPTEILQGIVDIARRHELAILADEIYDKILFDGVEHTSIASLAPDLLCLTFNGLSKAYRVAGFRSGWFAISGTKKGAEGFLQGIDLLSNMRLCPNVPAQNVVATALGGYQSINDLVLPGGRLVEQRDAAYEGLRRIEGIEVTKPHGALYIFPRIDLEQFELESDQQFTYELLRSKRILVVHGTGFNWDTPDHFRIVTLPDVDALTEAVEGIGEFLDEVRR